MSVDDYFHHIELEHRYWQDPHLRSLAQLLLTIQQPASGPIESFLSGTVTLNDPGPFTVTSGIVRNVVKELLEAAIIQHINH